MPLTQVSHPGEARVEADLLDFVCASQEEVDDSVGHDAVGESLDAVVEAPPHVQTVPVVLPPLNGDGLPVGGGVTRDLSDGPSHLGRGGWRTGQRISRKEYLNRDPTELRLTRSRVVLSRTSTSFSSLVSAVKMKSASTHSKYLVVTWETARFRPANQPWGTIQHDTSGSRQAAAVRYSGTFPFPPSQRA